MDEKSASAQFQAIGVTAESVDRAMVDLQKIVGALPVDQAVSVRRLLYAFGAGQYRAGCERISAELHVKR